MLLTIPEIRADTDKSCGHDYCYVRALRRLGVVLAFAGLAIAAGQSSAWAQSNALTREQAKEPRLYGSALVLARPGAGPALRRAGGVKLANALPVWRLPSGPPCERFLP